jgi:BRCA1-associated protein
MCIICGSINCGDNGESTNHREQHYINTGHIYARGINDYNVTFDFTRKTTLNRWFQNMILTGNNNIIEEHKESVSDQNTQYINEDEMKVNKANHHDELVSEFAKNPKEKVEYILGEYNSIISSQVESQRSYYINYINKIEETTNEEVCKLNDQIKELDIQLESLHKDKQITSDERRINTENLKNLLIEENEIEILTQKKDEEFKKMVEVKNKFEEAFNQSKHKNNVALKDLDNEIIEIDQEIDECINHIKTMYEISKRKDAGEIQGSSIRVLNFDNKGKKGKKK